MSLSAMSLLAVGRAVYSTEPIKVCRILAVHMKSFRKIWSFILVSWQPQIMNTDKQTNTPNYITLLGRAKHMHIWKSIFITLYNINDESENICFHKCMTKTSEFASLIILGGWVGGVKSIQ